MSRHAHDLMTVDGAEAARLGAPSLERAVLIRMVLGIILLVAVVGTLAVAFRAPLSDLAALFVHRLGALGVFVGMLFLDAYALPPLAHEPILFFAYAGGMGFLKATVIAGSGSFLAGPLGYGIGRLVGRSSWIQGQLQRFALAPLMRRRGVWVVAIAAVSPVPFSASTYLAGALRVPFVPFLLVCTLRYVKVAVYLGLIAVGWQLG